MEIVLGVIGYLLVGFLHLAGLAFVTHKFHLDTFTDYDNWSLEPVDNYGICIPIVLVWPMVIIIETIGGFMYLIFRLSVWIINSLKPKSDKLRIVSSSKPKLNDVVECLMSKGVDENEAKAIDKELSDMLK